MPGLSAIGFISPWLLLGLLTLPVLWWLLRAVPPAAIRRRFPAVTLLLGLKDPESTPDKTPWWLLLLRMLAIAAMIIGFAGPILNPEAARIGTGPLLILRDGGWAAAPDWQKRQIKTTELLREAGRFGRPVAVLSLAENPPNSDEPPWQTADAWLGRLPQFNPQPWSPDYAGFSDWLATSEAQKFETIWLSDGLAYEGKGKLAAQLNAHGNLRVIEGANTPLALKPARFQDGLILVQALRAITGTTQTATVNAFGPDPSGTERLLAQLELTFDPNATTAEATFDLPSELRNRIRRFTIAAHRSAGAVVVTDDALKRRKVALFAGSRAREGQELVSSLHFLQKALAPSAELVQAPVRDSLLANPDVVILADVASMTKSEASDLTKWVEKGGLLVRFAGPKLAASTLSQTEADPLLPVRLRAGGRNVGGAMSWGSPKMLQPFQKGTPFFGLSVPDDVTVSSQVIAQPDPELAVRTIASLQDGTPLVTTKPLGDGRIVLVHVTANAEWSTLPLSGLFVEMLERLAVSTRTSTPTAEDLAWQIWTPEQIMNGFGFLEDGRDLAGIPGERLAEGNVGPDLLPGTYVNGERQVAVNVMREDSFLAPSSWSVSVPVETMEGAGEQPLKALFLAAALGLLMLDILATLWLSGRLSGPREGVVAAVLLTLMITTPRAEAQSTDELALRATIDTVLAYVKTGDSRLDATSEAGLFGLSQILTARTSIEPADPVAVDLETDELAFYPIIYWPVSESQPLPSPEAYDKLNRYIRTGGMILFDTRDANIGNFGSGTPNGRRLQRLAEPLDIPALEPVPSDHVLTRSFYLLQQFPGRHPGRQIWVEAAPVDAEKIDGVPFRNLNDGVSPVVIGGNDWAAAWALTQQGRPMFPVGRGSTGERQREIAYRFGVNLVMYVLTGNYKSDQVHVPALLERLGQ